MTRPRHGMVIGKFYPPHAGHHLLVETAARVCERVSVLVLASSVESIPLEKRVAWLREVHGAAGNVAVVGAMDEHRVDYDDAEVWAAHVAVMKQALGGQAVDCVLTSEPYGEELARRFDARHICLDVGRVLAPISGSAVRADPVASWDFLAPPVRGWMARRVVLLGAESTGKSTLARGLRDALCARGGAHAETRLVTEYGREHALGKQVVTIAEAALAGRPVPDPSEIVWNEADFVAIAREQVAREEAAARAGGPVLVCDTDAFATSVWNERYLGARSAAVEAVAAGAREPALVLLTHHDDVPFTQDGTRDGEKIRGWMTGRFEARLRELGRPFVALRGGREQRLAAALDAVDVMLAAGWGLADPLG